MPLSDDALADALPAGPGAQSGGGLMFGERMAPQTLVAEGQINGQINGAMLLLSHRSNLKAH